MNWMQRITAAKKSGKFTEKDRYLAASWPKCAVGERFRLTKMSKHGAWVALGFNPNIASGRIADLGMNFLYHVSANHVEMAERVFKKIQKLPELEKA